MAHAFQRISPFLLAIGTVSANNQMAGIAALALLLHVAGLAAGKCATAQREASWTAEDSSVPALPAAPCRQQL